MTYFVHWSGWSFKLPFLKYPSFVLSKRAFPKLIVVTFLLFTKNINRKQIRPFRKLGESKTSSQHMRKEYRKNHVVDAKGRENI